MPYGHELMHNGYLVDASNVLNREASRRTLAHSIQETVKTLTDAGIKVVLMGQIPEMLVSPRHCLAMEKYLGLDYPNCGYVPRSEAGRRQFHTSRSLRAAAGANPDVFIFDPSSYFCNDIRCEAIKHGKLLYLDANHLISEGALALTEAFRLSLPDAFRLPDFAPIQAAAGARDTVTK
ncbi:MAG: hypothetical protein HY765_11665 [Rhodomicrobium sp.]|nr:hypothetical protein [Rhodomicrobium sp.]